MCVCVCMCVCVGVCVGVCVCIIDIYTYARIHYTHTHTQRHTHSLFKRVLDGAPVDFDLVLGAIVGIRYNLPQTLYHLAHRRFS
jgi:hypothetical protein